MKDGMKLKGFLRVRIGEDKKGKPKIVGDSGWLENQIVNLGWQDYIFASIGAVAGSKQIGRLVLGTSGAPASNATALGGETRRSSDLGVVTSGSFSLVCTTNFVSGTAGGNISNAALINDTASDGTIMCGAAFASSAWASNQAVSVTYTLATA
jgi:hypothetical protein